MHQIRSAVLSGRYRIKVSFSDGIAGEIDLSDLVGNGVFAFWTDPRKFAEVSVDPTTHTLAWPGGIDLCPDTIYEEIVSSKK